MRLGPFHLTYCTNIHPANGWSAVLKSLRNYSLPVKKAVSPRSPFGIGLRLSDLESRTLLRPGNLKAFKRFLDKNGLYVFTLNGFPFGPFHRARVKDRVHHPDWRSAARVAYTLRLARILSQLLPPGVQGSISTSPLSYKPWIGQGTEAQWRRMTGNVCRVARGLAGLAKEHCRLVHLDFEPEPDGLLETGAEAAQFFSRRIFPSARTKPVRALLRRHLRVCLDTCHAAVMFEEPAEFIRAVEAAGARIGKVQLSSALKIPTPCGPAARAALKPFVEPTYLHQVVQKNRDGSFRRFRDLPEALSASPDPHAREWRVHYHVPIFEKNYGRLQSTRGALEKTLRLLRKNPLCSHLEVETYTWAVLPRGLKTGLTPMIARELQYVRRALA